MIKNFRVDYLYESSFDGWLVKDIIESLQTIIERHGDEASMNITYDYDDCMQFEIMAPREETVFEENARVQQELREQQQKEVYERALYAELKEKYGE